jgi:hypothetical protein
VSTFLSVTPPLPWNVYVRRPARSLPFPFHRGRVVLFARARQGLHEGLQRLGLRSGDAALVPAYHHGSEIEAYVRAGLDLRYYDAAPDLAPDPSELESSLEPSIRVLHLIHYLGFSQDTERWRRWCDARGIQLVEDAAQGWLGTDQGRPLGTSGDLSLFSVYKTVGVPDGGAVSLRGEVLEPSGSRSWGVCALVLKHGAWFAGRSSPAGALWARLRGDPVYVAGKDFALGEPGLAALKATSALVPRLVASPVAEERVRRDRRLLAELLPWVPEPFRRDPEGLSPFAFPVFVEDKARAVSLLLRQGIRAVNAWSVPHPTLPVERYPRAARRRSGTLLLPVHQELQWNDLERIVTAARAALGPPPLCEGN